MNVRGCLVLSLLWLTAACHERHGPRAHGKGGGGASAVTPAAPPAPAPAAPLPAPATSTSKLVIMDGGESVYDVANDRTWLADANLAATRKLGVDKINASGSMSYKSALAWVAALNAAKHLGRDDWTLPTTPPEDPGCESHNRFAFGFGCRLGAYASLYGSLGFKYPQTTVAIPPAAARAGFQNFQPYLYWSETVNPTHEKNENGYSTLSFDNGFQGSNVSKNYLYVIPMIKGRFEPSSPADKAKVVSAGDVTWLANANLAATMTFGVSGITAHGSMTHDVAVKWIEAMNKASYLGSKSWQLPPTITPDPGCSSPQDTYGYGCTGSPLGRLYYTVLGLKAGEPVVSAPATNVGPFRNVEPYLYWSCHAGGDGKCSANQEDPVKGMGWSYSFGNGFTGTTTRDNALYVTAYHAGKGK